MLNNLLEKLPLFYSKIINEFFFINKLNFFYYLKKINFKFILYFFYKKNIVQIQ